MLLNAATAPGGRTANRTTVTFDEPSAGGVTVDASDPNSMRAGTSVDVQITGSGFVTNPTGPRGCSSTGSRSPPESRTA